MLVAPIKRHPVGKEEHVRVVVLRPCGPASGARPTERFHREEHRVFAPDHRADASTRPPQRRRHALAEVIEFVEGDAVWEKLTGLEFWFTPPPGTVVPQPSRARMAIVTIVVVYGLVLQVVKEVTPHPSTALGWDVENMETTVRSLMDRGVTFERFPGMVQDELGIWKAPSGTLVVWFKDPEGHLLSLSHHD